MALSSEVLSELENEKKKRENVFIVRKTTSTLVLLISKVILS